MFLPPKFFQHLKSFDYQVEQMETAGVEKLLQQEWKVSAEKLLEQEEKVDVEKQQCVGFCFLLFFVHAIQEAFL